MQAAARISAERSVCESQARAISDRVLCCVQGCGVVEFETPDQALKAIQMFNGQQVWKPSTDPACAEIRRSLLSTENAAWNTLALSFERAT